MDQQQQSRWRPTIRQLLWASGLGAVLTVAVVIGYRYDITLWDWIKLLVVPAVIAGGGFWFNRQQRGRELEIARVQREREVEIADRRAQDEALQAYLAQIGQLLLDKDGPLRQSKEDSEARTLARARTLAVLTRLDGGRKQSVVQFLYESGLITKGRVVVDLRGANLSRAHPFKANLSEADLNGANLSEADLSDVNLSRADLSEADLRGAKLSGADLNEAKTDLSEANLSRADLTGAEGVTNEELEQQSASLEGATMPNGQKYEDWLKDPKAQGKDEKNE